jgi:signal transduction histidine kinase
LVLVSLLALKNHQYNIRMKRAHREITEQKEEIEAQSEDLKNANNIIAVINRKLEVKVQERTVELRQAYKELDTFFYRSSHDFRRPLTTFFGLAEVAKITVKDLNALELFAKVNDTARNLDKMLVKLQSISDLGGQQLVFKEVFLQEMFDEACDNFREDIDKKGIKTYCHVDLPYSFHSYPALVKIIVENLVENSISFSAGSKPFIRLTAREEENAKVVIEIEDNGEGIEDQYFQRVFEMYFRGSERSKGNGLGLYIVKKAVEKLNGTISFRSEVEKGSTFCIIIPLIESSQQTEVIRQQRAISSEELADS